MSGTIRTSVSIDRQLRKRMNKISGRVNWSLVARDAFEAKLLEIEQGKSRLEVIEAEAAAILALRRRDRT